MNKKKIKLIISLSAVGLVVLLIGIYFLIGFCVPPDSYGLGVGFDRPRYHEGAFEISMSYKVGVRVRVGATLYNKSNFFHQKILYRLITK